MIYNAEIVRVDVPVSGGDGAVVVYADGAAVSIPCALSDPGKLFQDSVTPKQLQSPNVGRLYVLVDDLPGDTTEARAGFIGRGYRLTVVPAGRPSRRYLADYVFDRVSDDPDLSHYEIVLADG